MPINHHEIIEEIEAHIRKFGGEHSEWGGREAGEIIEAESATPDFRAQLVVGFRPHCSLPVSLVEVF